MRTDNLVPPNATGVPEDVRAANDELERAMAAEQAARIARRDAEHASRTAKGHDEAAAVAAGRRGDEPPESTQTLRQAELQRADMRVLAAEAVTKDAVARLEDAILTHAGEWRPAAVAEAARRRDEALAALGDFAGKVAQLTEALSVVHAVNSTPIERGRGIRFRAVEAGTDLHDSASSRPASGLIAELHRALASAVPSTELAEVAA